MLECRIYLNDKEHLLTNISIYLSIMHGLKEHKLAKVLGI